jgi:hypothetical protein
MIRLKRRRLTIVALFASLALIAAACSTSGSDSKVIDFAEIQSSDFEFTVDANGVAKMNVTTNVDAVCSIAWGETDDLGTIGTDLDMGGTAHDDHEVLLVGAVPGETYQFRVQGSDADGNLFQSELASFTLPEIPASDESISGEDDMAVPGDNLAEGATVVAVSSVFSDAWSGENAVDGDMSTEWATAGSGDDAFIEIDLGSPKDVIGVEFITRTMGDGTATTTEYTVTVDGGDVFGPFPAGDPSDSRFAEALFAGQVLRFDVVSSTGGNTGAIEVRVFASPGS